MIFFIGAVLLIVALVWVSYKMHLSYHSAGGTNLMDPIYDAAVYPPILSAGGLWCVLSSYEVDWPYWVYLLIWIGLTGLVVAALKICQEIGDKPL